VELRVGAVVERTGSEGPGERFALWVQGCRIRCADCCNPQFFAARGGETWTADRIVARLQGVARQVEGVTLLGGEPFDQADALAEVAARARALGLSVMTFTGYGVEELRERRHRGVSALLAATDLLVDGPYDRSRPESLRRWVGSTNQRFHFLTDRYRPGVELPGPGAPLRRLELELAPDGTVRAHGWPELGRSL
jgi:anaerobic ribonucleoside-triphosphate reductase activating protein